MTHDLTPETLAALTEARAEVERLTLLLSRRGEAWDRQHARAEAAEARIAAVRALHYLSSGSSAPTCSECGEVYPCATVRAMDGAT